MANKQPFDVGTMEVIFCEIANCLQNESDAVRRYMVRDVPASYADAIQRATAFVAWAMEERTSKV